jgi:hypothetical protein
LKSKDGIGCISLDDESPLEHKKPESFDSGKPCREEYRIIEPNLGGIGECLVVLIYFFIQQYSILFLKTDSNNCFTFLLLFENLIFLVSLFC